jgi:hypothetical protein
MDGQTDMVKPVYPPTTTSSSPEIIIGTETHLDPTYNNAKILPYDIASSYQYKIYRKELIDKNDGGVLIMVRPDIKSDECPDLDTECEICSSCRPVYVTKVEVSSQEYFSISISFVTFDF